MPKTVESEDLLKKSTGLVTESEIGGLDFHTSLPSSSYSLEDLARLYQNSIVVSGDRKFITLDRAGLDTGTEDVYLRAIDPIEGPHEAKFLRMGSFSSKFPDIGYYNLTSEGLSRKAIFLDRATAQRQWRYGFHKSIARISSPYLGSNGQPLMEQVFKENLETSGLNNLYPVSQLYILSDENYIAYDQAIEELTSGQALSVALNRKVALSLSPYRNSIGIFVMEVQVGSIDMSRNLTIIKDWAEDSVMEVCNA